MAAKRKTGLTLEQHKLYGRKLLEMRELLLEVGKEIQSSYPNTDKALRRAVRAKEAIDNLRQVLSDHAYAENRGLGEDILFPLYAKGE